MSAETARSGSERHKICILGRGSLEVSGVLDVMSFDEEAVVLSTTCGTMELVGASLHIHILNMEEGIAALDGRIDSLSYYDTDSGDKDRKNSFFSKLFR